MKRLSKTFHPATRPVVWALAASTLGALMACGRIEREAGALLGLVDDARSDRNAYLMFSDAALEEIVRMPVDETRVVNDTISDVSISANAVTKGKVGIELIPSEADARFIVVVDAHTHLDINGVYDPRSDIHIEMSGVGNVSTTSRKPVEIRIKGAVGKPTESTYNSTLEVTGVDVTASGWFSGYKRRQAEQQAWATINQELPAQQSAVGNRVAGELIKVIDERAGQFLLNFNATLVRSFRDWFVDSGYLPGKQLFQTTKEGIWFSSIGNNEEEVAAVATRSVIQPPVKSAVLTGETEAPIMLGMNEFALEHAAEKALGGKTFPAAAVSQLFVALGASAAPPVWTTFKYAGVNVTFRDKKPMTLKIEEGRLVITANFQTISQQSIRQTSTSLRLTYEARLADDRNIRFVRAGEPVVEALKEGYDPSQLLSQFTEEALSKSLYESFDLPVPDLSSVIPALKRLRMKHVRAEKGWIRLGATLDAINESSQAAAR